MAEKEKILADALVEAGHKLTAARRAILHTLVVSGGHITADDLADRVHEKSPRVGRMTVYRTLDLLTDLGLARPIFQGSGALRYILLDEGDHHHLICSRCHTVIEFDECGSGEFAEMLGEKFGFAVKGHLFEIHGLCAECRG
jgi:Fur family ferric uptake transcriptional regulator